MNEAEQDMEDSITRAVEEAVRPPTLRPVPPKTMSLSEQWSKLRSIDGDLRKRVRQEKLMITAEFDKRMVETNNDFDMRVEDAVSMIEADRRKAVQTLVDQTAEKLREHELLTRSMTMG